MHIIRKNIKPYPIKEGTFYNKKYFTTNIINDTDFYVNGKLLFKFRKDVINNDKWLPIAETHLKKSILTSNNRRMAGDDPNKRVNSGIVGYYDRLTPQMKHKLGVSKAGRSTKFIEKYPNEWKLIQPLFHILDKWYKKTSLHFYNIQKKAIKKVVPALRIKNTVFTTITINRDWRTATHTDKGDFKDSLSCIGLLGKNIQGGFLGFPQYRILVEMTAGDAILMNPHEPHCNTEMKIGNGGSRFSFVCYLREELFKMQIPIKFGDETFYLPKNN